MEWRTFQNAIQLAQHYDKKGTQGELSFTGLGESTLHPRFLDMLRYSRAHLPNQFICFSTNGLPSFTEDIARACRDYDVYVYVSLHRPEVAAKSVNLCREYGILKGVNTSAAERSFDWAGQLDWPVTADPIVCDYLRLGWGVVLVDGRISTCCLDAHGKQIIGHVESGPFSHAPFEFETHPGPLCEGCHMRLPDNAMV